MTTVVFLQPGDYFVGDAQHRIRTLLGSCVSITLWHPAHRIGAMSHFLLPSRETAAPGNAPDGRYGNEAMSLMSRELASMNIRTTDCVGKIFGGGNMFPDQTRIGTGSIGIKNGEAARTLLDSYSVSISSESLFGIGHREIIFDIACGDVWVRHVNPASKSSFAEEKL